MAVPLDQIVGDLDLAIEHVAMNLDVTRTLLGPYRDGHFMQVARRGARIEEHARSARNLAIDAMLGFDFARLMMDQRAELALLLAGAARENQQWHPLRERSRDGIHHV